MTEPTQPAAPSLEPSTPLPAVVSPPPAPIAELAASARLTFLWQTHGYLGEYSRFADTKAAFAGALAGALIGCLYGAGLFAPLMGTWVGNWTWKLWLNSLAGLFLCASVLLACRVVYPPIRRL